MSQISRRQFLRMLAASSGALTFQQLLTACGLNPTAEAIFSTATKLPQASPTHFPPTIAAGTPTSPAATPTAGLTGVHLGAPDIVVAHGSDPETVVRRALAAFGGMEKFVPKDARVLIKPNICVAYHTYEYAATTNPWVGGALLKTCLEAGARSVQVLDYPFGGTPQEAYARSGIEEQVVAAGGEMVFMPDFKFLSTKIPQGLDLKKTQAFDDAIRADVLINVPIAKHHSLARLTLGMKNLMGLIKNRSSIHANLGQRIADLTSLFQPRLTVVDAIRVLMENGPTGGDLNDVKQMDTVIVSPDIVAADSFATTLFGLSPEELDYIRAASTMGLGRSDLKNMRIEEITQ
jgi:uncharacterized protein (DUF362 family)